MRRASIVGNVLHADNDGPWAMWRVSPLRWLHATEEDKESSLARLAAVLGRCDAEMILYGLVVPVSDEDLAARVGMTEPPAPGWPAYVSALLAENLGDASLCERALYLAVRLGPPARLFRRGLGRPFGGWIPSQREVDEAGEKAQGWQRDQLASLDVRPVAADELRWVLERLVARQASDTNPAPDPSIHRLDGSGMLLDAAAGRGGARSIIASTSGSTCWASNLAVTRGPGQWDVVAGSVSGGEQVAVLEMIPGHVDWALRISADPRAMGRLKRRRDGLQGQYDQWSGAKGGVPATIGASIEDVDAILGELEMGRDTATPAALIVTVSGRTEAEMDALAATVISRIRNLGGTAVRPASVQRTLTDAVTPGPRLAMLDRFTRSGLTAGWVAGLAPFTSARFGDPSGAPVGVLSEPGHGELVLWDPQRPALVGDATSVGIVGRKGSGKSWLGKLLALHALQLGGQVVVTDRGSERGIEGDTGEGEWVRWARAIQVEWDLDVRIVSPASNTASMDPMLLPRSLRADATTAFLGTLAQASPLSIDGAAIEAAVSEVSLVNGRCIDVINRVAVSYPELAGRLHGFVRRDYGQLVFDASLPPLDVIAADCIVFNPVGLVLPPAELRDAETLTHAQVWGLATMNLLASIAHHVAWANRQRLTLEVIEEAHIYGSGFGQAILLEKLRQDRRYKAPIVLLSQSPDDQRAFAPHLGMRFVGRLRDHDAASATLFGIAEEEISTIKALAQGEFLAVDGDGRCARLRALTPPGLLAGASDTTPRARA